MKQILAEKPLILLTTSRRPTNDIRTFCKDFLHTFPNMVLINRGKLSLEGIAKKALELDAERVVIVDRWKGGPGKIQLFRISERGLEAVSPLIYLRSIKLRRDFGETMPRGRRIKSVAIAHLPKTSLEVEKFENALSQFFGIPKFDDAVKGKCDAVMQVSTDNSNHTIVTFKLVPEFVEVGPWLRISHLIWELNR